MSSTECESKLTRTVFGKDQFEKDANKIYDHRSQLSEEYWRLHEKLTKAEYVSSHEQMSDAQQLGQLAAAIAHLGKAQGILRCINGQNVVR